MAPTDDSAPTDNGAPAGNGAKLSSLPEAEWANRMAKPKPKPDDDGAAVAAQLAALRAEERALTQRRHQVQDAIATLRARKSGVADDQSSALALFRKLPLKPLDDPLFVDKGHRVFVWADDVTFTSSTFGEFCNSSDPIDVTDWDVIYVQLDVLDNDAADGDFDCGLATGFYGEQSAEWTPLYWGPPQPYALGQAGTSVVMRAGPECTNPPRQYLRWGVTHDAVGTHTIEVRVTVYYKSRARALSKRDAEQVTAVREAIAILSDAGVTLDSLQSVGRSCDE